MAQQLIVNLDDLIEVRGKGDEDVETTNVLAGEVDGMLVIVIPDPYANLGLSKSGRTHAVAKTGWSNDWPTELGGSIGLYRK